MKVPLELDPDAFDYGPATAGVRAILRAWGDIDWFGPARGDEAHAAFRDHLACVHRHDPATFPQPARVERVTGDWDDFVELCLCVRERPGWDWKYSGLKALNHAHARARSWSVDEAVPPGFGPHGGLWLRLDSGVVWTLRWADRALVVAPEVAREQAGFYLSYASMDVVEAIEWQLADGHADLADNPFVPLLATYAAGAFPFCMASDDFVLFELTAPLPEART